MDDSTSPLTTEPEQESELILEPVLEPEQEPEQELQPEQELESATLPTKPTLDETINNSQEPDSVLYGFYTSENSDSVPVSAPFFVNSVIENLNKKYLVSKVCVKLEMFNEDIHRSINFGEPHVCVNLDEDKPIYQITHSVTLDMPGVYSSYHTVDWYGKNFKINEMNNEIKNELIVRD